MMSLLARGELAFEIKGRFGYGSGYLISLANMVAGLQGRISRAHHSTAHRNTLKSQLTELADTGFEIDELEATLSSFHGVEPWRVGETLAECWLEDHRECSFPWKNQHDIRSLKASLPGTDLVGLAENKGNIYFAFGEVKTSSDTNSPPQVVYGDKGLTFQVNSLKKSARQRRQLIQNLGFRGITPEYKQAFKSHLRGKYQYWGMLIRDTIPSEKDLQYSINNIEESHTESTVEFIALYSGLPIPEWPGLCEEGRK